MIALALYAFSPDVIAHGSLATLDVPEAGFLLTSVWLLWRARRRPKLYLPLAGAALGAAVATKMSALPAVPVLMLLAVASVWSARRRAERVARQRVLALGAAGAVAMAVVALAVVWASYLVVDPQLRFTSTEPVPVIHGLRGQLVPLLPFPRAFRDGMLIQFGMEDYPWQGFLFGHLYTGSHWYYLPAALLVKTPLGMIALWAAGAVAVVAVRRLRPAAPVSAGPDGRAAGHGDGRLAGLRHAVRDLRADVPGGRGGLCAGAAVVVAVGSAGHGAAGGVRRGQFAADLPFYLPYSNEAFGGPSKTYLRLHDSNVDWGQDLGRLADRLRERYAGERVWLVYKGSGVPSYYGIESSDPRKVGVRDVHGLLIVSDTAIDKAQGKLAELIASSRPIDQVGHSITIYRR